MSRKVSGVHEQDRHHEDTPRWYAWCECGVCGPLRTSRVTAGADAHAHARVCGGKR
jgi:hypothetical protein